MSDTPKQLEAAREAVVLAATVCRQVQSALDRVREITKDDKSPVTVADFAAQAVVAHVLSERLGEIRLVGEETSAFLREPEHAAHLAAALAAAREVWPEADEESFLAAIDLGDGEPGERFWTLDPIDGTKGFLRGQQYAIALAFVEHGDPIVAAMGCPNLPHRFDAPLDTPDPVGCVYEAIRGDGVALFDPEKNESITIRRPERGDGEAVRMCASVESAHTNLTDTDRIMGYVSEKLGVSADEKVRIDSQCKYAVTARGQADAYLRMPTKPGYVERIWDHAAGALIATESGCEVTDIFSKHLDFGKGRGLEANKGVICASPHVHGVIIEAIRELGIKPA